MTRMKKYRKYGRVTPPPCWQDPPYIESCQHQIGGAPWLRVSSGVAIIILRIVRIEGIEGKAKP